MWRLEDVLKGKNEGREQRKELERNATDIANMTIFSERGEESREEKRWRGLRQ